MSKYRKLIRNSSALNKPTLGARPAIRWNAGTVVEVHDDSSLSGEEFVATYYGDLTVYLWREDTVSATEEEARARWVDVGASVERPESAAGHMNKPFQLSRMKIVLIALVVEAVIVSLAILEGSNAIAFLSPVIVGVTLYALGGYVLYRLVRLAIAWIGKRNT